MHSCYRKLIKSFALQFVCHHSSYQVSLSARRRVEALRAMALPGSRSNPVIMKLDSAEFRSIFTPELETLTNIFRNYGHEIRIAGGAVRDLLSGLKPKDLDFATTATPDEMKTMFIKEEVRLINMNGERHGTITPRINDKENFEVTTLRIDVVTDGRHAEVQFTTEWLLDALRRDLTINSMYLGLDGTVYDYFYGYDDLKNEKIRFVGQPETRILEDYLRILRYFRFYGRISSKPDDHDQGTIDAIIKTRNGLANISGERIWVELKKILECKHAGPLIRKMVKCGLAPYLGLPTKPNIQQFEEVWMKTKDLKIQPMTLLSALLNNIEDVMRLNERLKLSNYERDLIIFVVTHREPKIHTEPLMPFKQLLIKSKGKQQHIIEYIVEVLKYCNSPDLEEFQKWEIPKFPITGAILKENGIETGKQMGRVMNELKLFWADNKFEPTTEDLLRRLPKILEKTKVKN